MIEGSKEYGEEMKINTERGKGIVFILKEYERWREAIHS
jgi:hypothetical protein